MVVRAENKDMSEVARKIDELMRGLNLRWMWKESLAAGVAFARENVWSRAARRKKQQQQQQMSMADEKPGSEADQEGEDNGEDEEEEVALGVKITVKTDSVVLRWLRGNDSVVYESFCGIIKRALREVG
ncbi:hypothetical protein LTS18_004540 [Coniosporium uncinatum]|uniref:Uncharacterized protein n=1 Tax=Coniosporium uncinatum TaxID=93489 RepID=A0ACC3DSD1_9PEZI|nr:hypothetical protein LTS18_004540 [Coniosporium uncinatum]